jgi:anti-sigma factor RsiW
MALYLAGALPDDERTAFERHLAGCDSCLDESARMGSVTSALGQLSDDDIAAILALDDPAPPSPSLTVPARAPRRMPALSDSSGRASILPDSSRPAGARSDSSRPARALSDSSRPAGALSDSSRPASGRRLRRYLAYAGSAVALLLVVGFGALLLNDSGTQQAGAAVTASAESTGRNISLSVAVTGNAHGSTVDAHLTGLRAGTRYRLYATTTDGETHVVRDWSGDSDAQDVSGELTVTVESLQSFAVGEVGGDPFVTARVERPVTPTR